uniref:Uncharacterized protein n=1 Tax=Hyaloperonospora arabidopsidis (strain Emoy2) TaxID=559515 RepID=M4B9W5_HYAAE
MNVSAYPAARKIGPQNATTIGAMARADAAPKFILATVIQKRFKLQSHSKVHIQCKGDGPGRTTCWKNTNGNAAG